MSHERDVEQAKFEGVVIGKLDTIIFRLNEGSKRMDDIELIQKTRPCVENTQSISVFKKLAWGALATNIAVLGFFLRQYFGRH